MRARNRLTAVQIKNASDGKIEDGGGLRFVKKGGSAKWVLDAATLAVAGKWD
jgi:hypothetical protein